MNVRMMEDRLIQDLQQSRGQIINRISHSIDDFTITVGRVEDQIARSRDVILSRMSLIANVQPPAVGKPVTALDVEDSIERNLRRFSEAQLAQIQLRDARSERMFSHLERVFRTVTATPIVSQSTAYNTRKSDPHLSPKKGRVSDYEDTEHAVRQIYERSCICQCHRSGHQNTVKRWSLWGFKSIIGSVAFTFRSRLGRSCNIAACKSSHTTWIAMTYTFPMWLFHAALSITYSERTGSPELILRVLRRVVLMEDQGPRSLVAAAANGDLQAIKHLLRHGQGSVYDVRANDGSSVLQVAIVPLQRDHSQLASMLRVMLFEGADLFQQNDFGRCPCQLICRELYANPKMSASCRRELEDILPMDRIIEYCNFTKLHKIVLGITYSKISEYLRSTAGIQDLNSVDGLGATPLTYASARGDIATVDVLLKAGASPNIAVVALFPLTYACICGHIEIAQLLLNSGADVNARTPGELSTPLHYACKVASKWQAGLTRVAVSEALVATLLAHGADKYALDYWGSSILYNALYSDAPSLVSTLLDEGLDPYHRDKDGTDAWGNVIYVNAVETAKLFLDRGIDYGNVDSYGNVLLHYLARWAKDEMIDVIMDSGIYGLDITQRNSEGRTPMQLFNDREDSNDEGLRSAFWQMLGKLSRVQIQADSDSDETGSDGERFFDSMEN